jgi:23S rRNA (uracil1939-C5)-methyltransferase
MSGREADEIEIRLDSLAYGGDALGRLPDGRLVFVPYALPGERVVIRLTEDKHRYARAELVEVLVPSPERVAPRCLHFGACGGCHYQHMDYPAQLAAKQAILKEQLQRIAGIQDPPMRPPIPSPQAWGYRNHVQFHLTPSGALGYKKTRSDEAFPIQECHLPEEPLNAVWPQLAFEPLPGLERIGLRLGAGEEIQLVLESSQPDPPEISVEDMPLSVVHTSPWGSLVLAGSEQVELEVLDKSLQVSAGAFFQANRQVAERMVAYILECLPLETGATLMELYCGVGLFSAFIAPRVKRLVCVESSPPACADFEANLEAFDNVELYEATAEQVLGSLELRPDAVLVDPPRAGLGRDVTGGILALRPQVITYVSCDPATLGRDARQLIDGGYHLEHVTLFDAFPQTYHIESISVWGVAT